MYPNKLQSLQVYFKMILQKQSLDLVHYTKVGKWKKKLSLLMEVFKVSGSIKGG